MSDETEETIHCAFELVKEVLPSCAFFGNGPNAGPQIFMTDYSSSLWRIWAEFHHYHLFHSQAEVGSNPSGRWCHQ